MKLKFNLGIINFVILIAKNSAKMETAERRKLIKIFIDMDNEYKQNSDLLFNHLSVIKIKDLILYKSKKL